MSSWAEIIRKLSQYSDQVRKATRSLRDCFGVEYFTYHRIDEAGNYTVLLDRPDWAEHYVGEKFYLADPFQRHPRFFKPGLCLIDSFKEPSMQQIMRDGKTLFSLDLGVTVIEKGHGFVEFFGFAACRAHSTLDKLYLEQPSLLKDFGAHFKKELGPILRKMGESPGFLPHLKGDGFFAGDPLDPGLPAPRLRDFLSQIGHAPAVEKALLLSPREKECLCMLLECKSAKQIAADLDLSYRTVEFYFENIKNKLGCNSRQQLFLLAKKFHRLGLLP